MQAVRTLRKLPVEVQAVLWDGTEKALDDIIDFINDEDLFEYVGQSISIYNTDQGIFIPVPVGHWIIKGVNGELYPCSQDIVSKIYDDVTGDFAELEV